VHQVRAPRPEIAGEPNAHQRPKHLGSEGNAHGAVVLVRGDVPVAVESRLPSDHVLDPETISALTAACEDAWLEVHGRGSIAPHRDLRDRLAKLMTAIAQRGQRDPTKLRAYAVTFLR
jgi:hypothetical protein